MDINTNLSIKDLLKLIEKTKREIVVLEYDAIEKCNEIENLLNEVEGNNDTSTCQVHIK